MKKKIFTGILVLLTCVIAVLIVVYSLFFKDKDFKNTIKELTKNTVMVDVNLHHNQALDAAEHAVAGGFKVPNIIINFDTHSDFYFNVVPANLYEETIGEWVNGYVATYKNVDTVYWVMPIEEAQHDDVKEEMARFAKEVDEKAASYGNSINNKMPKDYFFKNPIDKKPFIQNCLIDADSSKLFEDIKEAPLYNKLYEKNHKYRKVKIHTVTLNSLPDLKGANVFLSIDADYFSNSGFDTYNEFKFLKSKQEIVKDFHKLFETLNEKHIRPQIISMTLSPPYLPQERHKLLLQLFDKVVKYSGLKDELDIYSRSYGDGLY